MITLIKVAWGDYVSSPTQTANRRWLGSSSGNFKGDIKDLLEGFGEDADLVVYQQKGDCYCVARFGPRQVPSYEKAA